MEIITEMKIEKVRDDWFRVTLNVKGKKITMFAYSRKEANEKALFLLRTGEKNAEKDESENAQTEAAE
jgi:hypothetical protein|tara:strand:- start:24 stop:227 length:204 start_codon:yes stop_codon:yes gene_type:complete